MCLSKFANILLTRDWKEMRIPFDTLSLNPSVARMRKTNQFLELQYAEQLHWLVHEGFVKRGTQATVWLDEVTFY